MMFNEHWSWTIFSNTLMLPRGSVLENISHNLAKHEQTRFRKYQVIAAGTVLSHHSFKSSCRSEQHLSWEIQNCCTRSIPIEWWQICISGVSLVEHLSMSDFPFPPWKIANVRDLVNVKSHSSYSVYIVDKAKASFAQRWKIDAILQCPAAAARQQCQPKRLVSNKVISIGKLADKLWMGKFFWWCKIIS